MASKEIVELLCELVDLKELTNRGLILKDINKFQNQLEKDLEVLEILKKHLTIEEDYYSQDNGSTKAIKLCISNCISIEEDDSYTDDCYPNPEYDKLEEWLDDK